jgi:hypothetical protein
LQHLSKKQSIKALRFDQQTEGFMISGLFEQFIKEKRYLNNLSERTPRWGASVSRARQN